MRRQPPVSAIRLASCIDSPHTGQRRHTIAKRIATICMMTVVSIVLLLAIYGFMCLAADTIGFYSYAAG